MNEPPSLPALDSLERALGEPLGDALTARFARYLELLLDTNERAGLTAIEDPALIVERHFAESVALLSLMREHEWTAPAIETGPRLADIGSGGGFPGVPMRLVAPAIRLTLVESHGRRAAFLDELAATLELDGVEVVRARAEEAGRDPAHRERYDIVTARAVAPLPVLVEYALPLLRPGGVLVTPKGSGVAEELAQASAALDALRAEAAAPLPLPGFAASGRSLPTVVLVRRLGDLDDRYPRRPGIPSKRPLGS